MFEYAVSLRRELHQYPEIGFDLPKTLALVRRELDAMGISYTEEFGTSSIVATINPENKGFTIGIRADMDALPMEEQTDVPFKSQNPGCMHACGHDLHTAMLLATARRLVQMKDTLRCRVKLLFTPAEEYVTPGSKEMAENGVMDDIDCAIACHVSPLYDVGDIRLTFGGQGANSMGITAEFFGTAAHANSQHKGVDAIRMAVESYIAMENMVAKELPPTTPRLLNIGVFEGGKTNNVICDYCKLFMTTRAHSDEVTDYMYQRIVQICEGIAALHGGRAQITINKLLPYVLNNEVVAGRLEAAAEKIVGKEHLGIHPRSLGGEDFGFLSRKKPCAMFQLGSRSDLPGSEKALHCADVNFDEKCMKVGMDTFVQFVLENQDGFEM